MSGIIETIEVVDVKDIEPMPVRIRKMDDAERRLLVLSIKELGYVEPIQVCRYTTETDIVRRTPPFYLIVNGQHRFDVLVRDIGVDKVSVVVLGENWDKVKYWSEAVRLNNIRGEFDVEKLAERIRELRKSIPDWNILKSRLGFSPKDKIFRQVLDFLYHIDRDKAQKLEKELQYKDISLEDLSKKLSEYVSSLPPGYANRRGILVANKNNKFLAVFVDDICFDRILEVRKSGDFDISNIISQAVDWAWGILRIDGKGENPSVLGPLTYAGGIWTLFSKVLRLIPPHRVYVEPFGGSGRVLFNKRPSESEVYNDINGDLVNFFRVLRDDEKWRKLREKLLLTPYSRQEFEDALSGRDGRELDDVERARRFFVLCRQSFIGSLKEWSNAKKSNNMITTYYNAIDFFPYFHARLRNVKIEHGDFENVIYRYDTPETFFLVDPPYIGTDESYSHLSFSLDDHKRLVRTLLKIRGKAMLLGYDNDIYKELEMNGWKKLVFPVTVNTFYMQNSNKGRNFIRNECIWLNYEVGGVGGDKRGG
jgi:DNA adenine methylase